MSENKTNNQTKMLFSQKDTCIAEIVKITEEKKHPLYLFWFNITLKNQLKQPRWFLINCSLDYTLVEKILINGAEAFCFEGNEAVRFAEFYGDESFKAFLLPGLGEILLKGLPISSPSKKPEGLQIWQTKEILIDGSNDWLQTWLPVDFLCPTESIIENAAAEIATHQYEAEPEEVVTRIMGVDQKWFFSISDLVTGNEK